MKNIRKLYSYFYKWLKDYWHGFGLNTEREGNPIINALYCDYNSFLLLSLFGHAKKKYEKNIDRKQQLLSIRVQKSQPKSTRLRKFSSNLLRTHWMAERERQTTTMNMNEKKIRRIHTKYKCVENSPESVIIKNEI